MGEHLKSDIKEVKEWLVKTYGNSETTRLQSILTDSLVKAWKRTGFDADYVSSHPECNAIVDLINCDDEWRAVLGKVVAYLYEVKSTGSDKEVWIVTRIDGDKDVKLWEEWLSRYKVIINSILPSDLSRRFRVFDFRRNALVELKGI